MRWVVLGASGFVGSALTQCLVAAGEDVRAVPAPRVSSQDDSVDMLLANAREQPCLADLSAALAGADVVVLAAGAAAPDSPEDPALMGANALLPAIVALACQRAHVPRMVHLSSAAVQGRTRRLDETRVTCPFSPYSRSKARGEEVLAALSSDSSTEIVVVRATSVQGDERATTASLQRIARSRLASVSGSGSAPSPVSSSAGLAAFVLAVGRHPRPLPPVLLQPWGGLSTADVLRLAGGREPCHVPTGLCRLLVGLGYLLSRVTGGRLQGSVRRVETLWFGQAVDDAWAQQHGISAPADLAEVLRGGR